MQQYRQAPPSYGHAGQPVQQQRPPPPGQRRPGVVQALPPHQSAVMPRAGPPQQPHHPQPSESDASYAERARSRRSRKPNDKNLPDGVEGCIIEPDVANRYKDLRDLERRLDATVTRKRLDIIESVGRETKVRSRLPAYLGLKLMVANSPLATQRTRTMRIWITNTVEDQHWQGNGINIDTFDLSPSMDASYRVKIEGRLLDDDDSKSDANPQSATPAQSSNERFSHFFKAMSVDFDKSRTRFSGDQAVSWSKSDGKGSAANQATAADFDELSFKRNGDENQNITINLVRHEEPERYQLSPELADVVDMVHATRQEATLALWDYIRLVGLQDDEEKRNFRCDDLLRKVINHPWTATCAN